MRRVPGGPGVRWRRDERLRHGRVHAEELRSSRRTMRMGFRRLLRGDGLRRLRASRSVWERRRSEHLRMLAQDLRSTGCELRHLAGRLSWHLGLRLLQRRSGLRWRRTEPLRFERMRGQVVFPARGFVRLHFGWVQPGLVLRRLCRTQHVRGRRHHEPVRLRRQVVFPAWCFLWDRLQRVRGSELRDLHAPGHMRWSRRGQPVRVHLFLAPCHR